MYYIKNLILKLTPPLLVPIELLLSLTGISIVPFCDLKQVAIPEKVLSIPGIEFNHGFQSIKLFHCDGESLKWDYPSDPLGTRWLCQ